MEHCYLDIVMELLYNMRLRTEGTVVLFENDAAPLSSLAIKNDMLTAAASLDIIGAALYDLREDMRSLHEACVKESFRQAKT